MRFRIAGVVGAIAVVAGGLIGASPAQAFTLIPINITSDNTGSVLSATSFGSTPAVGDIIQVTNSTSLSATLYVCGFAGFGNPVPQTIDSGLSAVYTITNPSFILLKLSTANASNPCQAPTISIQWGGSGGDTPPSATDAPADVMQQVGAPADDKCASITDTSLNWAGVTSGGWGLSWAQWLNDGKGGTVCSRSLSYNLNKAAWVLRE
jgi:hypothetical protein